MRQIIMNLGSSDSYLFYGEHLRQGEHLAAELVVNLNEEFQGYRYLLVFQLNENEALYTEELFPIENKLIYPITKELLTEPGTLKVELQAFEEVSPDNRKIIKSAITKLKVAESLEGVVEIVPEPYVPWYMQAIEAATTATEQANIATQKAEEVENIRDGIVTEEEARQIAEADRVSNEQNRIEAENERIIEENIRKSNEVLRQTNENTRNNNENERVLAENERIANEEARQTNEQNRETAETARDTAEAIRANNEAARIAAEQARIEAENTREANEATRQSNESARQEAEAARVSAEADRVQAEQGRATAENVRNENETIRQTNEAARVAAEQGRVEAEQLREQTIAGLDGRFKEQELKVLKIEKDVDEYRNVMSQINVNQEAKQTVSGYGIVSLPKNAANGQISVTVKGNTETDEEGNTKSTISAMRLKSVSANETETSIAYVVAKDEESKIIELRSLPNGVKDEINVTEGKYIQRVGVDETDPSNPTFTRSSVAYLSDGTQVAANQPRFEQGKFGKAIMMEEGTTNLLAKDLGGAGDGSIIGILVPNKVWAKRITVEAPNKLFYFGQIFMPAQPNTKYTLTYWARLVSGSVASGTQIYIGSNSQGTGGVALLPIDEELTSEWKKFVITGQTDANATILTRAAFRVVTDTGCTVEIADWQLEAKPYPTSFTDGTRAAETLTIPTEGVLNPQEGTVEMLLYVNQAIRDSSVFRRFFEHLPGPGNSNRITMQHNNAPHWLFTIGDANGNVHSLNIADSEVADGWRLFTMKWGASEFAVYVDGVKKASISNPTYLPSAVGQNIIIKSEINTLIDDLRISSIARSDEEIAAAYQSGQPLPVDEYTTYKLKFDDNLNKERATPLFYQLAEPEIIENVQVSGTLLSYPSGTIYIENATADAGIYGEEGITVLHEDLPIKELETLSKIDFVTGLETKLDISKAVINQDKLSFTHPDLEAGDIVFFTYFYDREGTQGEFAVEYYDSRYVVKDSVTDKFYKWSITVSNGTPSISLMEV